MTDDEPVLLVYLEPAPYIVKLVEHLRQAWRGRLDVLYAAQAMSQPWATTVEARSILPRRPWSAIAEIRRRLVGGEYALVHLAGWGHPTLLGALALGRARHLPVVVESDTPRGPVRSRLKEAIKGAVYPWLFSLPARFLPGGTPQADYLHDYGVSDDKITIAMMTVDVAEIESGVAAFRSCRKDLLKRLGLPFDAVQFLYVGRLEPHKGVSDLIAAYEKLRQNGEPPLLLIAGDGSLRGTVESATSRSDAIRYFGRVEGDRLWEAYAAADVLVVPSLFEPWGLVVNEGMAAGLPVIVTNRVGSAKDLVTPNETGLVVPVGSPDALAAAMATLAADPDLRAHMGRAAKAKIAPWTMANWAARTTDAWRLALQ